jgi:glycosyltransferase involved in cell wall biosynthesis
VHGEHGQIQPQDLPASRIRQRRWLFRLCQSVHVVSASLRDNLHALGLDHVPVIVTPNGVDSARFVPPQSKAEARRAAGFAEDDRVIGIVGRLVALKRHRLLFEAFGKLAPEMPALRLLVVGDGGAEKEDILRAMKEHPLAGRIKWAGHQDDVKPFYQSMDLLAAPSEIEGLSNAVLEAMACGTPVLGHAACGNAEVLRHGENGFLAQLDSADQLAAALREALSDEALLARCSTNARDTVERQFSMEAMAESYRQLYRNAVRSKPS